MELSPLNSSASRVGATVSCARLDKTRQRLAQIAKVLTESLPKESPTRHWYGTVWVAEADDEELRSGLCCGVEYAGYRIRSDPILMGMGEFCSGCIEIWVYRLDASAARSRILDTVELGVSAFARRSHGEHSIHGELKQWMDALCPAQHASRQSKGFVLQADRLHEYDVLTSRVCTLLRPLLNERGVAHKVEAFLGRYTIKPLPREEQWLRRACLRVLGFQLPQKDSAEELTAIN